MKVYFYGATYESATKKVNTFMKQLMKMKPEGKDINFTSISEPVFKAEEGFPIPQAYRVHVFCEYSLMATKKG